jgi:hypothetical protein
MSPKHRPKGKASKPQSAKPPRKQEGPIRFPEGMTVEEALRRAVLPRPPK